MTRERLALLDELLTEYISHTQAHATTIRGHQKNQMKPVNLVAMRTAEHLNTLALGAKFVQGHVQLQGAKPSIIREGRS